MRPTTVLMMLGGFAILAALGVGGRRAGRRRMRLRERFACRSEAAAKPWTAGGAGWEPRMELIHNEHEPEQNGLAWSPETMRAPYLPPLN
jgi:hypothetical protein